MVAAVEGGHREVVVQGVDLVAFVGVDRRLGVLPDVADDVEELALLILVDRAGASEVLQIHVAWSLGPAPLIRVGCSQGGVPHVQPLSFRRQSESSACLLGLPLAEGVRFQLVHLRWPRPLHGDLLHNGSELELSRVFMIFHPEPGVLGLLPSHPLPALLVPVLLCGVASSLHELVELRIGHNVLGRLEGLDRNRQVVAVVDIPTIARAVHRPSDSHSFVTIKGNKFILWGGGVLRARRPEVVPSLCRRANVLQGQLSQVDRGGLDVDALMLDSHGHDPIENVALAVLGVLESERQGHGVAVEEGVHPLSNLLSVVPHGGRVGEVVVLLVQVVPGHLVDPDGEHLLELRVQP
mmetsp:Transcript_47204/g.101029  ORF Transcript_47204/g.101029 Transcript_47204/m.101029 type:complete len:352 (-) Transcript_47204:531-1586(-)